MGSLSSKVEILLLPIAKSDNLLEYSEEIFKNIFLYLFPFLYLLLKFKSQSQLLRTPTVWE